MNYDEMQASRELDLLIAKHVMGWILNSNHNYNFEGGFIVTDEYGTNRGWFRDEEALLEKIPPYSTDISAMWRVVLKMRKFGYSFDSGSWENMDDGNDWHAAFEHKSDLQKHAIAPTFELAVCRAALKAVAAQSGATAGEKGKQAMRDNMTLSNDLANHIFDILITECEARKDDRISFLHAVATKERTEFRFQGNLGFGGKFYRQGSKVYISCYPEDLTSDRRQIIDSVNSQIKTLMEVRNDE